MGFLACGCCPFWCEAVLQNAHYKHLLDDCQRSAMSMSNHKKDIELVTEELDKLVPSIVSVKKSADHVAELDGDTERGHSKVLVRQGLVCV